MDNYDPLKHPDMIPLDAWYRFDLQMVAECLGCGRTRVVHRGELIRRFGGAMSFNEHACAGLAPKLMCIHCGRRGPKLSLAVRKD